jgi:heterodisulfide reductase subunit A
MAASHSMAGKTLTIAFYYMDIQPAGVHFADFLSRCREDSDIRFIRSIPSKVYHAPATDSLRVKFADAHQGEIREENFDMVILSVGMTVKKEAKSTADFLGMAFDDDGFIIEGSQTKEGIFATGACTGPKDIERSLTQAKSTAANVYQYVIGSGFR